MGTDCSSITSQWGAGGPSWEPQARAPVGVGRAWARRRLTRGRLWGTGSGTLPPGPSSSWEPVCTQAFHLPLEVRQLRLYSSIFLEALGNTLSFLYQNRSPCWGEGAVVWAQRADSLWPCGCPAISVAPTQGHLVDSLGTFFSIQASHPLTTPC